MLPLLSAEMPALAILIRLAIIVRVIRDRIILICPAPIAIFDAAIANPPAPLIVGAAAVGLVEGRAFGSRG